MKPSYRIIVSQKTISVRPFLILMLLAIGACKKEIHDENEAFAGRYKVIFAYADIPVDLNLDGIESVSLPNELPEIRSANLELKFNQGARLYAHFWPKPSFRYGNEEIPSRFDPNVKVNYPLYASVAYFSVDKERGRITLDGISSDYIVPDSIKIVNDTTLNVFFRHKVYTSSGWKDIMVRCGYERFTTEL